MTKQKKMGRLLDEGDVINALLGLRRSLQMMDNTQRADFILQGVYLSAKKIEQLPSAQPTVHPQRTCVNCGRTANNGGWYADGGTRCPIEEHYALPKDGFCHLWEKRNVTDDDYPEGRADE